VNQKLSGSVINFVEGLRWVTKLLVRDILSRKDRLGGKISYGARADVKHFGDVSTDDNDELPGRVRNGSNFCRRGSRLSI
jgi:hypothetical protein